MDAVDLAKRLISFETVSPVRDTEPFVFIQSMLEQEGIEAEIVDISGVKNLVARTGDGGPRICLNGHLDVVEPGRGWTVTRPFQPVERDGRLYGRGAADMKTGLAAQIAAFMDLHRDDDFAGEAVLMVAGDEEIGGFQGTMQLLKDEEQFEYAIIGEPTDMNVQVGVRGIFWANVYIKGASCHASRPGKTDNITDHLPAVLEALRAMELTYEPDPMLPDPTAPITGVETSGPHNSIPGEVRIGMDIRHLPSMDADSITEDIHRAMRSVDADIDWELDLVDHGDAFKLDDEHFRAAAMDAVEAVTGRRPDGITAGGSSDGRFFAQQGTPFIELGVNQGPGHRVDESCALEDVRQLRTIYADIARRLAE